MIYILDNDPKKTAEYLDDKSLDTMIRDLAQVLCNVHYLQLKTGFIPDHYGNLPLWRSKNKTIDKWAQWARECKANYLYLVELGRMCLVEYYFRKDVTPANIESNHHRSCKVVEWARDNIPDLPLFAGDLENTWHSDSAKSSALPLIIPKKYQVKCVDDDFGLYGTGYYHVYSYRNYYQARLEQRISTLQKNSHWKIFYHNNAYWETVAPGQIRAVVTWTNRNQPEWLEL